MYKLMSMAKGLVWAWIEDLNHDLWLIGDPNHKLGLESLDRRWTDLGWAWWWRLVVAPGGDDWRAGGGSLWRSNEGQWEERALGKRKQKWRRRRDKEEPVGERDVTWWDESYGWAPRGQKFNSNWVWAMKTSRGNQAKHNIFNGSLTILSLNDENWVIWLKTGVIQTGP